MARKSAFGRFLGAVAGSPYQRLSKMFDKLLDDHGDDENELGRQVKRAVKLVQQNYEAEKLDADEHDLLMEQLEDMDPQGRQFPRLEDEEDSTDWIDNAEGPTGLTRAGGADLDDIMRGRSSDFESSFATDEYAEYKARMTDEFLRESDESIRRGGPQHVRGGDPSGRVFSDPDDVSEAKRRIAEEAGIRMPQQQAPDPRARAGPSIAQRRVDGGGPGGGRTPPAQNPRASNAPTIAGRAPAAPEPEPAADDYTQDPSYRVDEDGYEWYEDSEGVWWFRTQGVGEWEAWED